MLMQSACSTNFRQQVRECFLSWQRKMKRGQNGGVSKRRRPWPLEPLLQRLPLLCGYLFDRPFRRWFPCQTATRCRKLGAPSLSFSDSDRVILFFREEGYCANFVQARHMEKRAWPGERGCQKCHSQGMEAHRLCGGLSKRGNVPCVIRIESELEKSIPPFILDSRTRLGLL